MYNIPTSWYLPDPHSLTQLSPEAEFLDIIGTKVFRVFLLAIHSHIYKCI